MVYINALVNGQLGELVVAGSQDDKRLTASLHKIEHRFFLSRTNCIDHVYDPLTERMTLVPHHLKVVTKGPIVANNDYRSRTGF